MIPTDMHRYIRYIHTFIHTVYIFEITFNLHTQYMYTVRHLKITRRAWETAHEAGDFLPTWLGRLVAIWQIHWGNGISQKKSTKIPLPKTLVSFFRGGETAQATQSYSKLLKLVGQIVSMQSRVWWWEPEALGAGETEKGSSMDAVGEYPEWGQPADPPTHQEVSIISWFEYGPGGILSTWGIWSGSWIVQLPCIVTNCPLSGNSQFNTLWSFFCIEQLEGLEEPSGAIKGLDKRITTYDMHKGCRAQLYS